MGTIRLFKVWLLITLMVLSGGSLSYAQTNTFPSSGNVGIGTTSPAFPLDIQATTARVQVTSTTSNNLALIGFTGGSSNVYFGLESSVAQTIFVGTLAKAAVFGTDAVAATQLATSNHVRMTIGSNGNVGVGTTSPTSKLHVVGDAKVTGDLTVDGNIAAKYQDVAEWVRSPALAAGTVVVIDPNEANRVLPASQAYDTRVAGVVSSQPGIILGEAGEDKAKVAHSGRVKVKADAQFGPISVGDLLVSSATSGYAMVSKPIDLNGVSLHRPGTIVGKALEPLRNGQGEILVLLTLQ